jgi:hypothetical protein
MPSYRIREFANGSYECSGPIQTDIVEIADLHYGRIAAVHRELVAGHTPLRRVLKIAPRENRPEMLDFVRRTMHEIAQDREEEYQNLYRRR